ncbi:Armadillo-like helical [Penicillium macrosclerotiorum]|uniref:Armadillo-like helical n=1 Tax=Penicillium macrosclerotiorum TaxID=303699 RepID=UPI0025485E92|nr:Armadillo-like helical [Penicillium macrosclerotiorum]KAJ5666944.1 Armadillo-like helical [Penicillium macrosclerotiorum]
MASGHNSAFSASTHHRPLGDGRSSFSHDGGSVDGSWNDSVPRSGRNGRSGSGGSATASTRAGTSLAPSFGGPGSFSAELKSMNSRSITPRPDGTYTRRASRSIGEDDFPTTEERQAVIRDKIAKEMKIKSGTENMLEALLTKPPKQIKEQRLRVESELSTSNRKLVELQRELEEELLRAQAPSTTPPRSRLSSLFRGSPMRSPSRNNNIVAESLNEDEQENEEGDMESPTYVLTETLQALEIEGMSPDFYVERANSLVELFKRYPTLKYDLAWPVFGLRVQVMLLSDSKEVVAAGYRLTRYAIADRKSLQTIRALHTDELVILSLVKESKASIEREQALKFVRAFLDVKDGVKEISRAIVRTIVSVAEHHEDRLRNISIMTLAEMLVKDPQLVASAGGFAALHDALAEGTFGASESLISSFLHVLDTPHSRKYLQGCELEAVLAPFTDSLADSLRNGRLKSAARAISAMLKTWPGLVILTRHGAKPLQSLLESLHYPDPQARDLIMELLFDALRIKPPSWSSSFLAGRRLTTYGRVSNLRSDTDSKRTSGFSDSGSNKFDLTAHFSTLILAALIAAGLPKALSELIEDEPDLSLRRKATLLLTEVLKLAHHSLPATVSSDLQVLAHLLPPAIEFDTENHDVSTSTIFQIESINRTLARSGGFTGGAGRYNMDADLSASLLPSDQGKDKLSPNMDEQTFRNAILETHVLNTVNFNKWKWDLIHRLVEGPLTNPKRVDEAIKGSKFMKRLIGFYRPFKYRFSMVPNSKPNYRYVRTGCALMRTLVQTAEGTKYLAENKFLRQVAECLAQLDRMSGLTSASPLFSREQMSNTMSGGYFAMLGTLSADANGLLMMERWHMLNMFYHIIELQDRNDLIQTLLGNMDYSRESHLRVMLSKALTIGSKEIRIFATKLLRKYAVGDVTLSPHVAIGNAEWVVKLLVTQLYDPDVMVCQIAVKILEEACNQRDYLEFVVKCRPSLDHLGEIGAPLLLRFLSTSVGYHYLDGLDYITQEMDDWFLGRNDSYVGLVEAALSRAYVDQPRRNSFAPEDLVDLQDIGVVPPHFYRELARTAEGCKLLEQSGHFNEFAWTIRDFRLEEEDTEVLLKVKGCLWAVGNVGSMELGAPFLEQDIVQRIVTIAESAGVLTMRGTAFFVLGLISRSRQGLKVLQQLGWDSAIDQNGESLGLCLPADFRKLFLVSFPGYDTKAKRTPQDKLKEATTDSDPVNQKILKLIVDMGNTVLSKRSASDLHSIKSKQPERFHQVHLFRKALCILESHHFRLPARRFTLDLFDKSVMRRIVFEDESSGSESDSST